jgi:Putative small multi-drug export protein
LVACSPDKEDLSSLQVISRLAIAFLAIAMVQMPLTAHAAKKVKDVTEHLHTGQKVANFFRTFGIPDLGVLAIISALPVVELRGSIPVGIWMGYPITTVLPVCVLGNMAPIVPLLYLLRNKTLK